MTNIILSGLGTVISTENTAIQTEPSACRHVGFSDFIQTEIDQQAPHLLWSFWRYPAPTSSAPLWTPGRAVKITVELVKAEMTFIDDAPFDSKAFTVEIEEFSLQKPMWRLGIFHYRGMPGKLRPIAGLRKRTFQMSPEGVIGEYKEEAPCRPNVHWSSKV